MSVLRENKKLREQLSFFNYF